MIENKLKVGQTFEVVEVLGAEGYTEGCFKIGGHSTIMIERVICNGFDPSETNITELGQHSLYLEDHELKPIGKLTITKVK